MSENSFSVAFHIGLHKTATSHLQKSLLAAKPAFADFGVRYLGPTDLRQPDRSVLECVLQAAVTPDPSQPTYDRLVLSEENYIGVLNIPRQKPLLKHYPKAATRLTELAQAMGREIDVLLAIRRPTEFLNATYCQQLMSGRVFPVASYRTLYPTNAVDWFDLVSRLRAAKGVGRLVVWCYEDYKTHFPAICAALVGPAAAEVVKPLDKRVNSSLSAAAVAELLHRDQMHDKGPITADARRLLAVEAGFPRFDAYTPAEHAANDALYLAQVAAIGAMPGISLLEPLWATSRMRA
ncbi:hypothetical protein [Yoonia sp.]|uniref:hypothetical protein n=1 Tax=Yoonia sp. TaxID=2212373 RepID=UPI003A4DCE64